MKILQSYSILLILFGMAFHTPLISQNDKVIISGGLEIGSIGDTVATAGTIRFNPVNHEFEGFNGFYWVSLSNNPFVFDTITDYDGNEYLTVTIGEQEWMAENYKCTTFWLSETPLPSGYWSWYDNDPANDSIYGKLYRGDGIVSSSEFCPEGWEMPSAGDYSELFDHLGGELVAGGKMKATGTQYWNPPNTGATNTSFFSALPGGYWSTQSGFGGLNSEGAFRITDEYRFVYLTSSSEEVIITSSETGVALDVDIWHISVRCIKQQ